MEWLLDRTFPKEKYTIGNFFIDGRWYSSTIEDADRCLHQDMGIGEIRALKVYGETAIPKGRYKISFTYSPKFASRSWAKPYGGKVISIDGVKGFDGIRIHPLNYASESLGCIGVGLNTIKGGITQSTKYYLDLVDHYLLPALACGEEVYLTIK